MSIFPANQPTEAMPAEFPWRMPPNVMPKGYAPTVAPMSASRPVMSTPPHVVHALPRVEEVIYYSEPFGAHICTRKWMK